MVSLSCCNCGSNAPADDGVICCPCSPAVVYCSDWCRRVHWVVHSLQCTMAPRSIMNSSSSADNRCVDEVVDDQQPSDELLLDAFHLTESMNYDEAAAVFLRAANRQQCSSEDQGKVVALLAAAECRMRCSDSDSALKHATAALASAKTPMHRVFSRLKIAQAARQSTTTQQQQFDCRRSMMDLRRALMDLDEAMDTDGQQQQQQSLLVNLRDAICEEMGAAIRKGFPQLRIQEHPRKGLCMYAAVDLPPGALIAGEAPLLEWTLSNKLFNESLFEAFAAADGPVQRALLAMHCPPLPPGGVIALHRAALEFTSTCPHAAQIPLGDVLRLAVASKCNAHSIQQPNSSSTNTAAAAPRSCFYDVLSKVSHSCEPCMMYDGAARAYVVFRHVATDEELTFSYFGSQWMLYGTHRRRRLIRDSYLFWCNCARCDSVDFARGIKCSVPLCRGTIRRDGSSSATDGRSPSPSSWSCDTCHEQWADEEMPLEKESALEGKVMKLSSTIETQTRVVRNQFEELKSLLVESMNTLGTSHWTYLVVCKLFVVYFITLAEGRAIATRVAALTAAAKWLHKFLRAADAQHITRHCPAVVAEVMLTASRHFRGIPELFTVHAKLLRMIWPFFSAALPESTAAKEIRSSLAQTAAGVPPSSAAVQYTLMPEIEVEEEEGDLLLQWEDYLLRRVSAVMNSQERPQLPPNIVHALARPQ